MRLASTIEQPPERPLKAVGAGPFITLQHLSLAQGVQIWQARDHRKGLGPPPATAHPIWRTHAYNTVMAAGFAVGSMLFITGAYLSLAPDQAQALALNLPNVNLIFFFGSIFFTLAAYLQLSQAAHAEPHPGTPNPAHQPTLFGWRPRDPGWLASATQFVGTLLFNANTFDAMLGGGWLRQDLLVWGPDMAGSILFLISGYLTVIETCHSWFNWRPRSLAWWIVMINLLGCIAFMGSAIFAFVPPAGALPSTVALSIGLTFVGAVGFLVGALLSILESALARVSPESPA